MSARAWVSGLTIASLFWVTLFVMHFQFGHGWLMSIFLAFGGMAAGMLGAIAILEFKARK